MGDAVMAFWGAPLADREHARNAVRAALGMVARVDGLRDEFRARGWPEIHIGVGISSGPMNVGNMGSRFRMAYTVLGDTVNLGSRLEGLTKQYGVSVAVSAATAAAVPDYAFRELDLVRVKGKLEPVAIYEPIGPRPTVGATELEEAARLAAALASYRRQAWDEADAMFAGLEAGEPRRIYSIFRERIRHFRRVPPPPDWDGVFVHEQK
jgi:adenylate cyclase